MTLATIPITVLEIRLLLLLLPYETILLLLRENRRENIIINNYYLDVYCVAFENRLLLLIEN